MADGLPVGTGNGCWLLILPVQLDATDGCVYHRDGRCMLVLSLLLGQELLLLLLFVLLQLIIGNSFLLLSYSASCGGWCSSRLQCNNIL